MSEDLTPKGGYLEILFSSCIGSIEVKLTEYYSDLEMHVDIFIWVLF